MAGGDIVLGGTPGNGAKIHATIDDDMFGIVRPGESVLLRIADGADSIHVGGNPATNENLVALRGQVSLEETNGRFFFGLTDPLDADKAALYTGDDTSPGRAGAPSRLLGLRVVRLQNQPVEGLPSAGIPTLINGYTGGLTGPAAGVCFDRRCSCALRKFSPKP